MGPHDPETETPLVVPKLIWGCSAEGNGEHYSSKDLDLHHEY